MTARTKQAPAFDLGPSIHFLVMWRGTMDDVPIAMYTDRDRAIGLADKIARNRDPLTVSHVKACIKNFAGIGGSSPVNVRVISIVAGLPHTTVYEEAIK